MPDNIAEEREKETAKGAGLLQIFVIAVIAAILIVVVLALLGPSVGNVYSGIGSAI
jgi:hypothetical protein